MQGAGQGGNCGFREREHEKYRTRIVRAEESLRGALLKNESLMTAFKEYIVLLRILERKLEENERREMVWRGS